MRRIAAILLGLLAALCLVEIGIRTFPTKTRIQAIRNGNGKTLREVDGVILWDSETGREAATTPCAGRPLVSVFGTSILIGSGLDPEERFTRHLPGTCFHNYAESAFQAETMLARAREILPVEHPSAVIWELWPGNVGHYTFQGKTAYNLMGSEPPPPFLAPLIPYSRAVEVLWASTLEPRRGEWRPWEELGRTANAAMDLAPGVPFLFVVTPPLNAPFREPAREMSDDQRAVIAALETRGGTVVSLAERFIDKDVAALRLDTCCHYNADGHRALAEVFAPWLSQVRQP